MTISFAGIQYDKAKIPEIDRVAVDLVTIEGFSFPSSMKKQYHMLSSKYDMENGLNLNFGDLVEVYTFTLKDPIAMQFLREERIEQTIMLNVENIVTDSELIMGISQKDYAKTLFFRKYYGD